MGGVRGAELACVGGPAVEHHQSDQIVRGGRQAAIAELCAKEVDPRVPLVLEAGELAALFPGWKIETDEVVEGTPDWGSGKGQVARFAAQKM